MQHIGFIMDGNRRWAKKLWNIPSYGHEKGGESIDRVLQMCLSAGIPHVSLWALSKENVSGRSADELTAIYGLIRRKIPKLIKLCQQESIRFQTVGDIWLLPTDIRTLLHGAIDATSAGTVMTIILALWYSGQDEIVRATKRCLDEWIDPSTLDETTFLQYLDSGAFPPPDLIVRTGWNIRHSGFFLYQSAYSEYYFTETLWPDFDQAEFDKACSFYEQVKRNFWK